MFSVFLCNFYLRNTRSRYTHNLSLRVCGSTQLYFYYNKVQFGSIICAEFTGTPHRFTATSTVNTASRKLSDFWMEFGSCVPGSQPCVWPAQGACSPAEGSSPGPLHPPPGSSGLRVPSLPLLRLCAAGKRLPAQVKVRWEESRSGPPSVGSDDDDDDDEAPLPPPPHNPVRRAGTAPPVDATGTSCHVAELLLHILISLN